MRNSLANLRNIGISAHIDSGKTTLSERILFYTGRIHRSRRFVAKAPPWTTWNWRRSGASRSPARPRRSNGTTATINLIDTPGHVDFTVEVERSLRVLDGAVLVLCAVGGVQAQSITIDRQMQRYHVPRVAFINKMDRIGANPDTVVPGQLREKLGCDAVLMQRPIGSEADFEGVVDLITQKAIYFDGEWGEEVRSEDVPETMQDEVAHARQELLEALAMFSDELMELLLAEEEVPESLIHDVVRSGRPRRATHAGLSRHGLSQQRRAAACSTQSCATCPHRWTASTTRSRTTRPRPRSILTASPDLPTVAMAFKIVEDPYGA